MPKNSDDSHRIYQLLLQSGLAGGLGSGKELGSGMEMARPVRRVPQDSMADRRDVLRASNVGTALKYGCGALIIIMGFGWVQGAGASTEMSDLTTNLPDAGSSLIRLLGAMFLVLAIFFGGVWLFRNGNRLALQRGRLSSLNVVEAKSLGNRQMLVVVGYGQQRMLVGTSPAGVSLLCHLADETAAVGGQAPTEPLAPPNFRQTIQRMLARPS